MVSITLERYVELLDKELQLDALECAGVDNWEGFDDAMEIYNEWKEDK